LLLTLLLLLYIFFKQGKMRYINTTKMTPRYKVC